MTKAEKYRALCFYLPYGFKCRIGKPKIGYFSVDFTANWLDYINKHDKYNEFKIIGLRIPQEITVAEMKEAAKLFVGGEIFTIKEDGIIMVHHLRGGPDIYPEFNLKKFFRGEYGLESLEWILSKGFDIFGLIEAGLTYTEGQPDIPYQED